MTKHTDLDIKFLRDRPDRSESEKKLSDLIIREHAAWDNGPDWDRARVLANAIIDAMKSEGYPTTSEFRD